MIRSLLMLLLVALINTANAQQAISKEMSRLQANGQVFESIPLLTFQTTDIQHRDYNLEGLKKGTILTLDKDIFESIFQHGEEFISIPIPVTDRTDIVLTLKRHEIFTPDFKVFTSSDPDYPLEYTPGIHYRGIVEGDPNSIVALSVFKDQVMAMIATDEGNMVIGPIKGDKDNRHVFYNERDLEADFQFECGTEDNEIGYTKDQLEPQLQNRDANDCVRIYVEINDDIVTAKGGAVPATDYITAILNQCFVLYANDQISMVLSEIKAWTTNSPYTGGNSSGMLSSYQSNTGFFNGDLSHLISFDSLYGGVAPSLNGYCSFMPHHAKCFSGIRYNYANVPLFSWPVFVITHEMGHLLGSHHTHACVWNGNSTAIDGCGSLACAPIPPLPPDGGTIMSYCYPSNGSFINFNLGFGPQPGTVIRNSVNAASNCLSPCGQPVAYCESTGAAGTEEYIKNVVIANLSNQSGNNSGYANFTSLAAGLTAGTTYTITLTPNFTGGNKTKYWRISIDYNNDFDWYDAGECVAYGTGSNTINLTFTVPPGTPTLSTRMRVSMKLAGFPAFCGLLPFGEVEDYTINVTGVSPTCSDGIQNQGETGVDCGGPCPPCPPAPTCTDGIQNQNETGVDCGGACPACPVGDSTILLSGYFETGMDSWIDGGPDVARVSGSNAWEGQYSIELADNSGAQSAMTSPVFDLSTAVGLQITFHFKAVSMESGEDFWVQYKNGSGSWNTIGTFTAGSSFNNGNFYAATVTVPNFVPTTAGSLRIQCDASDNSDHVYIDEVTIIKLNGTELIESGVAIQQVEKPGVIPAQDTGADKELVVYPNPASDLLNISFDGDIQSIRVISLEGKAVSVKETNQSGTIIDISSLATGIYFLFVESNGEWYPAKFSKM